MKNRGFILIYTFLIIMIIQLLILMIWINIKNKKDNIEYMKNNKVDYYKIEKRKLRLKDTNDRNIYRR